MEWREHITVNPAVLHGKARIRGTRIPVAVVLANLADGLSAEEILRSYPDAHSGEHSGGLGGGL